MTMSLAELHQIYDGPIPDHLRTAAMGRSYIEPEPIVGPPPSQVFMPPLPYEPDALQQAADAARAHGKNIGEIGMLQHIITAADDLSLTNHAKHYLNELLKIARMDTDMLAQNDQDRRGVFIAILRERRAL